MKGKNNRREERTLIRFPMQYEKILDSGELGIAVKVYGQDMGLLGVGFVCKELMELSSLLKITMLVSDADKISFEGRVARIEVSDDKEYIVGVQIDKINDEDKGKLDDFLRRANIKKVLQGVNLKNVIDIYFTVGYPPVMKKIGEWVTAGGEVFDSHSLQCLLFGMLDRDRHKKFLAEKELNFVYTYSKEIRFRVNMHMQRRKVEAVFRLLPYRVSLPSEIGVPPVVEKWLNNNSGLIIIAGRTGSGKSTTIASLVELYNQEKKGVIVSLEDPIEYLHTDRKCIIKQREIGVDTLSFANAARNALRQDPTVLVIGEILDQATMEVAITAAESGILVFTTLHAANSTQALDRVISFFPPEVQRHMLSRLALVLRGVTTQLLLPRMDKSGFTLISEVVTSTDAVKSIIRNGDWAQIRSIIQTGKNEGMQTFKDSLENAYRQGLIDAEYLLYEEVR